MSDKIKLVTSKLSPYGHRVEMVLIEKNIPYEKVNIDLSDKPDWFVKDSPFGKVPLLYVGDKILFESIAICEYLEEAFTQNPLHSKELITKATHLAWMEISNGVLAGVFGMVFSQNQEQFELKKSETISRLAALEKTLEFSPYFEGEKFSLVDACLASSFKPLNFIDTKFTLELLETLPKTAAYVENLIARGSLSKAVCDDYEEIFKNFLTKKNSHLLSMIFSL